MLTNTEKQMILTILQDPRWKVIENAAEELIQGIEDEYIVRETEWDTIKAALNREGKIEGIRSFIAKLYKHAQEIKSG